NKAIAEHPSLLYDFVRSCSLSQITAASLTGKFDKTIRKLSNQLIDAKLVQFLASDADDSTTRRSVLNEALQDHLERVVDDMFYMFMENGNLVVNNQNVIKDEPQPVKKKKFLGLF